MTIKDLKEFLGELPEEFDSFSLVNGEFGSLGEETDLVYRKDSPIQFLVADDDNNELVLCHQTEDEINNITNE